MRITILIVLTGLTVFAVEIWIFGSWLMMDKLICPLPAYIWDKDYKSAPPCLEFWINRYQTVLAAAIAFVTAVIAARPVYHQLREQRRQSNRILYEQYDRQIGEIDAVRAYILKVVASTEVCTTILRQLLSGEQVVQASLEIAREVLSSETRALATSLGSGWGNRALQADRKLLRDEIYRFEHDVRMSVEAIRTAQFAGSFSEQFADSDSGLKSRCIAVLDRFNRICEITERLHDELQIEEKRTESSMSALRE